MVIAGASRMHCTRLRRTLQAALLLACLLAGACGNRFSISEENSPLPPEPPEPLEVARECVSLLSAVGLADGVRLEWRLSESTPAEMELAVWLRPAGSGVGTALGEAEPLPLVKEDGSSVLRGLSSDTDYTAQLALRVPGGSYQPVGLELAFRVDAPIYVNPKFDPGFGDGLSPATAYGDLLLGIVVAFSEGGGNVFVSEGTLESVSLPLFEGVHLYGGFAADFVPQRRNPRLRPVTLRGAPGAPIVQIQPGNGTLAIFDGFTLDGQQVSSEGVQDTGLRAELRRLEIRNCARGMRLRTSPGSGTLGLVLCDVECSSNGLEGVSVDGAFDLFVDACAFRVNGAEGLDLDALRCPDQETAELLLSNSTLDRNAAEGLDLHLAVPPDAGTLGGEFRIEIVDCNFELNGLSGARLDIDYEAHPQWSSRMVVRGVRARANGGSGLLCDLDSSAQLLLARCIASANAEDGLRVSSESAAGIARVHACVSIGNAGCGLRAEFGQFPVLASMCVFAANTLGAARSETVDSWLEGCVLLDEPALPASVRSMDCLLSEQPPAELFVRAPLGYARVTGLAAGSVTLDVPFSGLGDYAERADDGMERTASWTAPGQVTLTPADELSIGDLIACYAGAGVEEDWRTPPGSPAEELGPFGGSGGGIPGREDALRPERVWLGDVLPRPQQTLAAQQTLTLRFVGGTIDAGTLAAIRLTSSLGELRTIQPFVIGDAVEIPPPGGGWAAGDRLSIGESLRAVDGRAVLGPVSWVLRVQ